ncbi:hypothetical protein ABZP36_033685 [Zizania latifolia]
MARRNAPTLPPNVSSLTAHCSHPNTAALSDSATPAHSIDDLAPKPDVLLDAKRVLAQGTGLLSSLTKSRSQTAYRQSSAGSKAVKSS